MQTRPGQGLKRLAAAAVTFKDYVQDRTAKKQMPLLIAERPVNSKNWRG
jgi:hypothetical protein